MLGKGGFGIVWKGIDVLTRKEVAIKQELPEAMNKGPKDWFKKEVETHLQICQDPCPPRVPKFITQSTNKAYYPFFIMEFVPGETADKYYERPNFLTEGKAITFLFHTLETLQAIHQKGFSIGIKPDTCQID